MCGAHGGRDRARWTGAPGGAQSQEGGDIAMIQRAYREATCAIQQLGRIIDICHDDLIRVVAQQRIDVAKRAQASTGSPAAALAGVKAAPHGNRTKAAMMPVRTNACNASGQLATALLNLAIRIGRMTAASAAGTAAKRTCCAPSATSMQAHSAA